MALAACGDDSGSSRVDGAVDSLDGTRDGGDAMQQVGCSFEEAADATNDLISTSEMSGLTISATRVDICGTINNTHYDATNEIVDADFYRFTIAADTDILVHLTGSGIGAADDTVMQVRKIGASGFFGFGIVEGDHGTIATRLVAGEYAIGVGTFHSASIAAPVAYRFSITTDAPLTRCPAKTDTTTHAEGADNGANNVVDYESTANPESTLSNSGSDTPEVTGITAAPGTAYLVTGTSANVNPGDDYMDRDTYAFTTGATTNQMSVRLNWTTTPTDLDFRVYPQSTVNPLSIVGGLDDSDMEHEFETFAVKPNTTYWLWVAAEDGSTAPATYSATLCGETFSP